MVGMSYFGILETNAWRLFQGGGIAIRKGHEGVDEISEKSWGVTYFEGMKSFQGALGVEWSGTTGLWSSSLLCFI